MSIDKIAEDFNRVAANLQTTEFRRPRTPAEWQRIAQNPGPRDYSILLTAVEPFLEAFTTAGNFERSRVEANLSLDALATLRTFVHSSSILAVRRGAPTLIALGLAAVAVLAGTDDVRDLTIYLAALYHAGTKLEVDVDQMFEAAADLSESTIFRETVSGFPRRAVEDRALHSFGLRETNTHEGFNIVEEPL